MFDVSTKFREVSVDVCCPVAACQVLLALHKAGLEVIRWEFGEQKANDVRTIFGNKSTTKVQQI